MAAAAGSRRYEARDEPHRPAQADGHHDGIGRDLAGDLGAGEGGAHYQHTFSGEGIPIGGSRIALGGVADFAAKPVQSLELRRIGRGEESGRHDHVIEDPGLLLVAIRHVEPPPMRADRSHARHSHAEMDEIEQVEFCGVGGEVFDDLAADREDFTVGRPRKVGERAAVMREIGPHVGGPGAATLAGPHAADIQRALKHNGLDLVFRQRLGRS